MTNLVIEMNCRQAISIAIRAKYGPLAEYCAMRGLPYTRVVHLLRNGLHGKYNPAIVEQINADTGADMSAWEK
jgi:hypothetical protein